MGVESRRPPLPAPTDVSSVDNGSVLADDLATDVSRVTEKTSYSIPEDGSPVTITTKKTRDGADPRTQSQTSLLIEYFEGGKNGDKPHPRPSVRVRVTPSSRKSKTSAADHIQITETKNRKPSYTRRISLGRPRDDRLSQPTEISVSDVSNVSGDRPPVEVEVLQQASDISRSDVSRDRRLPTTSDISSMPPDSMLDSEPVIRTPARRRSQSLERDTDVDVDVEVDRLKAPTRRRSRSLSRERITQKATNKVMEKLKEKSSSSSRKASTKEETLAVDADTTTANTRSRRKSGRVSKEEDILSGTESSLLSSNVHRRSGDTHSIRSGSAVSGTSSINNPKLLQTVEDAIRRLILPELNALKEEQKTQKNREKFERVATRDSIASASSREDLRRRVSKTSSAPDFSKPKVVLSRHGEDRDIVISGDSVKSRSSRRSSRASEDTVREEEEKVHRKSSKDKHHRRRSRDAVAAGVAAGALTAAALKHHDSHSSVSGKERKKRRSSHSKSHSRTESISDSIEEERVPPMPMQSEINPSEMTRDSILTAESERDQTGRSSTASSRDIGAPIQEVMRGSTREMRSPLLRTPPRTPSALRQGLTTHRSNRSLSELSLDSAKSDRSLNTKAVMAGGLAAAAAAATSHYEQHRQQQPRSQQPKQIHDEVVETDHRDDYVVDREPLIPQRSAYSPGRPLSPIQSVASYREEHDDVSRPGGPRSVHSTGSMQSASREVRRPHSSMSIDSLASSPSTKVARTRKRPTGVNLEKREDVLTQHERLSGSVDGDTSSRREADDFFEKNHEENERYRQELRDEEEEEEEDIAAGESPLLNYNKHMVTHLTDDSLDSPFVTDTRDIRGLGRARVVNTPLGVESAVASLHEPSTLSMGSSQASPTKDFIPGAQAKTASPVPISTPTDDKARAALDMSPSKERWQQIKEHARSISEKSQLRAAATTAAAAAAAAAAANSPRPSLTHSEPVKMGTSALPLADDPLPEIGYHDDALSEVTTNPSEIKGPLGGYDYGDRSHWPADPTPLLGSGGMESPSLDHDHFGRDAAVAGIAGKAANRIRGGQDEESLRRVSLEDEYHADPADIYGVPYGRPESVPDSPGMFHQADEGYISTAQPGDVTPEPYQDGVDRYTAGYDAGPDPFVTPANTAKHTRHLSGMSHGMGSPLYDSATGRGIDAIQSKDIVALMDHLTVRDAQRNARDTEMLVTLVRSAAEMRNQFEEMKRFIAEQDAMIMQNTTQQSNVLGQKILQGPRPQPLGSPRVPRNARGSSTEDATTEDLPTKRKSVFRRALKGLSMKSSNDLAKIEDMLMQLLNEVEGLKEGQTLQRAATLQGVSNLTSYDNLRASGDPGYEPEGHAGTSSTPNHSGYLSNPSSSRPNGMHSGYQAHRISTVQEDEEEFMEHENKGVDARHQYEEEPGFSTPTQEARRAQTMAVETPPQMSGNRNSQDEDTPRRKHKSNNSSIFGIPRISRWSKTTASTPPDPSRKSRDRPYSEASRSGSDVNMVYDDEYALGADDRLRSNTSLPADPNAGYGQRPPSPLIPETDDPKYQAHRNSLNLQHPQPRPGPTQRHQNHLESQAQNFAAVPLTGTPEMFLTENKSDVDAKHDQWGSNPSLILNRAGQHTQNLSPIGSDRGYASSHSAEQMQQPPLPPKIPEGESPLVPPKVALEQSHSPYADVPGAGYVSPHSYSSGHLAPLAPIEEVRYSLETDGGRQHVTPSPKPTPQRKITGPRPMGSRSPSAVKKAPSSSGSNNNNSNTTLQANIGTVVRRKPVSKSSFERERDREFEELESYRSSSPESETF